jgi:hypothetical protein
MKTTFAMVAVAAVQENAVHIPMDSQEKVHAAVAVGTPKAYSHSAIVRAAAAAEELVCLMSASEVMNFDNTVVAVVVVVADYTAKYSHTPY